ncbi:MAG: DUF1778 domain-containing protein [Phycisphaerales bacterium]
MSTAEFAKVTIRQPLRVKEKVERAAALRGMTVTSFVNGILERVADRTIARARERELSEHDSRVLLELLREPGEANDALQHAAARYRRARRDGVELGSANRTPDGGGDGR